MRYRLEFPTILLCLLCFIAIPLAAQDADSADAANETAADSSTSEGSTSEDTFSADALEEDLFGSEDDIFGEEEMIEELPAPGEEESDGQEAFLDFITSDAVEIGGRLTSSMAGTLAWEDGQESPSNLLSGRLGAQVYLNARPSKDLRIFLKTKIDYPFSTTTSNVLVAPRGLSPTGTLPAAQGTLGTTSINTLNLSIFELYTDVNLDQTLYFRFGKQTVNWGVGIFWSPADIISLTAIDREDTSAEREGPLALKVSFPFDLNLLEAYVIIPPGAREIIDTSFAARGSFFFDFGDIGLETQIGIGYQREEPLRIVTSFLLPLPSFNIFLEGRLSFGRDGNKLVSVPKSVEPLGATLQEDTAVYFSGTAGFSWIQSNIFESIIDLTLTTQYYFQMEGYSDTSLIIPGLAFIGQGKKLGFTGVDYGQHYTALSLGLNQLFHEDLNFSVLWQANWSDLSGLVITSFGVRFFDGFRMSLSLRTAYGESPSQYYLKIPSNPNSPASPAPQRVAVGLTFNIGGGQF